MRPLDTTTHAALAYIEMTVSQNVTISGNLSVTLSLPANTPVQPYYVAFYESTAGWQYDALGPVTPSNGTITFNGQTTAPITLTPGVTYAFALTADTLVTSPPTATPSPTPTPTPTPTATPTPTPTPTPTNAPMVFSPAHMEVTQAPTPCASPMPSGTYCFPTNYYWGVSITHVGGYLGPYTATPQNPNIVSAFQCYGSSIPPQCTGGFPENEVLFSPVGVGSTVVNITDGNGISQPYNVAVTLTTIRIHIRNLPTAYAFTYQICYNDQYQNYQLGCTSTGTPGITLPQPANGSDFTIYNAPYESGFSDQYVTVAVNDGAYQIASATVMVNPTIGQQNYVDITPQ